MTHYCELHRPLVSASFCFLPNGYVHPLVLRSHDGAHEIDDFVLHELASAWN